MRLTYSELLHEWYKHHIVEIEESTAYDYEKTLPYIEEALGDKDISDITELMIFD